MTQKKYRILIIEDDPYSRELMTNLVALHEELELVASADTGNSALSVIHDPNLSPIDLMLLDINLPDMTGIEFLEKLDEFPFVIFTTAYEQYAVKAFEFGAVDYLLKPITQDRFNKGIERFIQFSKDSIPYDIYHVIEEMKGPDKYKKSSLTDEQANQYAKMLLNHMEKTRAYTDYDLTLKSLSSALSIPGHHLSQVINIKLKMNFYMFINNYRVSEAKKLLSDPENRGKTLLDLSLNAGFKSKSVFNQVFREIVGTTPRSYREEHCPGAADVESDR